MRRAGSAFADLKTELWARGRSLHLDLGRPVVGPLVHHPRAASNLRVRRRRGALALAPDAAERLDRPAQDAVDDGGLEGLGASASAPRRRRTRRLDAARG